MGAYSKLLKARKTTVYMSQKLKRLSANDYYYEERINFAKKGIRELVTDEEYRQFEKYDIVMINQPLARSRRSKVFSELLKITRLLDGKSWLTLTKEDIDILIAKIMTTYAPDGEETNTTYDDKTHFKIFFRWFFHIFLVIYIMSKLLCPFKVLYNMIH